MKRPDCIKHIDEIQSADDSHYPQSTELLSYGSAIGKAVGLKKLGIHHEILPPGRRTSFPHCEKEEEEFFFVIEGTPDLWLDGELHRLKAGDGIGFPSGTGICHTVINNSDEPVRLLVVGEANKPTNQVYYPLNAERRGEIGDRWWSARPNRPLGPHDGLPDAVKK